MVQHLVKKNLHGIYIYFTSAFNVIPRGWGKFVTLLQSFSPYHFKITVCFTAAKLSA